MNATTPSRRRRRLGLGGALAVAVVVVAGCSDGGPDVPQDDAEYFGYVQRVLREAENEHAAQHHPAIEEAIAACMADQGFVYVPTAYEPAPLGPEDPPTFTVDEAQERGYGITTGTLEGEAGPTDWDEYGPETDEYLRSLTASEHEAWHEAYLGIASDDPGCYARAHLETPRAQDPRSITGFEGLVGDMNSLSRQAWSHPAVLGELAALWECLDRAGYPAPQALDAGDLWLPEMLVEGAQNEAAQAAMNSPQSSDEIRSALADYEIEVATADARCREQVGLDAALVEARDELQRDFVRDHRTELEEYLAAVAERAP